MSASVEAAPGDVVSETEHATTYEGATAATFEGENTGRNMQVRSFPFVRSFPIVPGLSIAAVKRIPTPGPFQRDIVPLMVSDGFKTINACVTVVHV